MKNEILIRSDIFGHDSNIFRFDLFYNWFQLWWHWFQIEFNVFSRFHFSSFPPIASGRLKTQNTAKKRKTSTNYGKTTRWLAHVSIPSIPGLVAGQISWALSTSLINSSSSLLLLPQNPPNNNHKLQKISNRYAQLSIHSWPLLISHWDWQTLPWISNDWLRIDIDTN